MTDLQKLYNSEVMDPDDCPQSLQNKVQFDLRFFMCRRGNENLYKMTKDTFKVKKDLSMGLHYVVKTKDELDKNHSEKQTELVSGIMPELPGNVLCPVESFIMYLDHLHPDCPYLWQCPKNPRECTGKTRHYYYNKRISENTLATFMSKLSHSADLSQVYTNHSVRVTGTTFLTRANFTAKQVMSVTGHQSVNTLAIYKKVNENDKMLMGMAMNYYL